MLERRQTSLGALVLSMVEEEAASAGGAGEPAAAAVVERLVAALPGFADAWRPAEPQIVEIDEEADEQQAPTDVPFLRKAQRLVRTLGLRFGPEDARFRFRGLSALTLDSGARAVGALLSQGIVRVADERLRAALARRKDLGGSLEEAVLRAAAVEAGRRACRLALKDKEDAAGPARPWPELCLRAALCAEHREPTLYAPHSIAY